MVCTFFGHSFANATLKPELITCLRGLIEKDGAAKFLVGNHGNFDRMVWDVLLSLKKQYGHIVCYKVLAYLPSTAEDGNNDTVFPEDLESIPKKFAIIKRNEWMIKSSDTVITYVKYSTGGAYRFKELAKRKGKNIIELYK